MHARWLVDVAALLTYHSHTMIQNRIGLPRDAMNRYWLISRQRMDAWNKTLREYRECLDETGASYRSLIWKQLQSTIEEVFLSDLLVRSICAVSKRLEDHQIDLDSHAIAASIFSGQEDSRNRCLHLMTSGIGQPLELAMRLNRIRQSMETWSDTLIGMVDEAEASPSYLFDRKNMYVYESHDESTRARQQRIRWQFMISGCQQWVGQHCVSISANPELNEAIHRSAYGMLQPSWMESMQYNSMEITASEKLIVKLQKIVEDSVHDEVASSIT